MQALGIRVQCQFAIVGGHVGAVAFGVEQVAIGFAVGAYAGTDCRAALEHAHRVARRRNGVDLDVFLVGAEVVLLDIVRQAALLGDGKAGCDLHPGCATFQKTDCVRATEHATGCNQGNVELFALQPGVNLRCDGGQVILRPVHPEPQMTARQRPFHDHIVGEAASAGAFLEEQLQRPERRHDDAQLDVAKAWMVLDQRKRAQVQSRCQGDAINPCIHCSHQPRPQGFPRAVHGELFHAVDEDQSVTRLARHGALDMGTLGLSDQAKVKLDRGLVTVRDVVLVLLELVTHVFGVVAAITDGWGHGIGNMPDPPQSCRNQREVRGGNIHPHSTDHDRHEFALPQFETKVVHTLHDELFIDSLSKDRPSTT